MRYPNGTKPKLLKKPLYAWHFVGERLRFGGCHFTPDDGVTLRVDGMPRLCRHGLHASLDPLDAAAYMNYPCRELWLCRVALEGWVTYSRVKESGAPKLAATERTIIKRVPAEPIIREALCLDVLHYLHDSGSILPQYMLDAVMRRTPVDPDQLYRSQVRNRGRAHCSLWSLVIDALHPDLSPAQAASNYTVSPTVRDKLDLVVREAFHDVLED